jgi:NitT/TauT family transport system substrate-binding protein
MQRRSFLGALAALPLLSACGGPNGSSVTDASLSGGAGRLAVGMIPVAHFAPVYIAQQEGFFNDEGLEVTTQVIQSSAAIVPSVINGQLQIGTSAGTPFINPVVKNLPIRAVAPAGANPASPQEDTIAVLVAPDGPQSIRELEGVPMAVNAIGSQPHIAAAKILLDAGGDPKKMQPIAMPMPDSLAALQQGRVMAAAMAEPFVSLGQQQGARILTALYSVAFQNTGAESVYFASQAFIDSRREEVEAFNRAIIKANQAANEDHSLLVNVLVSKLDMKEGLARKMVPPTFATDLKPATLQEISHVMVETGFLNEPVPAERLVI